MSQTPPSSPSRSVFRMARKGAATCRTQINKVIKHFRSNKEETVMDIHVLEEVFKKLGIEDRLNMGMLNSRTQQMVDRIPLIFPLMMITSDDKGNFELQCEDHMDLLKTHILRDFKGYISKGESIVFTRENVMPLMYKLASRLSGITQFWLDTADNGLILQTFVDRYQAFNDKMKKNKKFDVEQLTVVGSVRPEEIDSICSFLHLCRRRLQSLRLRHCRILSAAQSSALWASVSLCSSLHQLQYEPCRMDKFSRQNIVDAVKEKKLTSLILTGVDGLNAGDIYKMSANGCLEELAVVGTLITPATYSDPKAHAMIERLENLLIQVDSTFNLDDPVKRDDLFVTLSTMRKGATMEIIHLNRGSVLDTTRAISYWLTLARETGRTIKLKLEECSQERQDAAIGRLMRKCREVQKVGWSRSGLTLSFAGSRGGKITILDKNTWFGDESNE